MSKAKTARIQKLVKRIEQALEPIRLTAEADEFMNSVVIYTGFRSYAMGWSPEKIGDAVWVANEAIMEETKRGYEK